jgi:hypothetical protein
MDPTRKDAGLPLPGNLQEILARAKDAIDQKKSATVELHLSYDMATGEMQMAGPRDPLLFYGILELARDAFNAQQQKGRAESERRIEIPPGALADEGRVTQ